MSEGNKKTFSNNNSEASKHMKNETIKENIKAQTKKAQNEIGADAEADDCDKKPSKVISFYEKLFSTAHKMKPIEIFYQRFYHYPQSFYFYEALQHTKVQAVKVNLVSKSLLDGVKLVMPASIKVSNSVDPWALAD